MTLAERFLAQPTAARDPGTLFVSHAISAGSTCSPCESRCSPPSRYLKRRVLVAEMSEEARRRKREMWRAAARRHRDRKTGAMPPGCPPAGDDLFDDWAALRERAESPARELDRHTWSALRGHCQEHGERDV